MATHGSSADTARSWPRLALAGLAGSVAALALPPWHAWWLLPPALGVLVWLLDDLRRRASPTGARMWRGAIFFFLFSLGWFGVSLAWVGEAFLVDAQRFAALRPLAWLGLPALLALFHAAAGALLAATWRADGWRVAQLAAALALADMARSVVLSGFPWNLFAHVLPEWPMLSLMQAASLVGVHGLSFLVLLWAAALVLIAKRAWRGAAVPPSSLAVPGVALATLLTTQAWGMWSLRAQATTSDANHWVLLVHTTVPQREKWKPENRQRIINDLLTRSRAALRWLRRHTRTDQRRGVALIWPESAVPLLLNESPGTLALIAEMLQPGEVLLSGALRRASAEETRARLQKLHNSVLGIDDTGRVRLVYDKRKLVPFGETLPLAALLEPLGVRKLVPLPAGFVPGRRDGPFTLAPMPPLEAFVCYEVIFPDLPGRGGRAAWMVNVSNDGWFGDSAGPWQHFQAARFRAIEQGLPLARATNAGITALFSARGRTLAATRGPAMAERARANTGERAPSGVIIAPLPTPLAPTVFSHAGNWPAGLAMLAMLVLMGRGRRDANARQR